MVDGEDDRPRMKWWTRQMLDVKVPGVERWIGWGTGKMGRWAGPVDGRPGVGQWIEQLMGRVNGTVQGR
jgi:hypothetical protein